MISNLIPSSLDFLLYMLIERVLLKADVPILLTHYSLRLIQNSQKVVILNLGFVREIHIPLK